jgi:hypothetical protein
MALILACCWLGALVAPAAAAASRLNGPPVPCPGFNVGSTAGAADIMEAGAVRAAVGCACAALAAGGICEGK